MRSRPVPAVVASAEATAPDTKPHAIARNTAQPFDTGWFDNIRVNLSAAERRVATLPGRRSVKKDAQAGWLLKAITCIDLTTLNGDDTAGRVKRLCAKAAHPIRQDILDSLGMGDRRITTGAVCVYHRFVSTGSIAQKKPSPEDTRFHAAPPS